MIYSTIGCKRNEKMLKKDKNQKTKISKKNKNATENIQQNFQDTCGLEVNEWGDFFSPRQLKYSARLLRPSRS
jgi:hypothetical protein